MEVGIIADTHGLVRESALAALAGVDILLHAGDVGKPHVLEALQRLAPVVAVRGNIDRGEWADALPIRKIVEVGGQRILLIHKLADLDEPYERLKCQAIVVGHSHRPELRMVGKILLINPGSAGPRRFGLPVSIARMIISGQQLSPQLISLLP